MGQSRIKQNGLSIGHQNKRKVGPSHKLRSCLLISNFSFEMSGKSLILPLSFPPFPPSVYTCIYVHMFLNRKNVKIWRQFTLQLWLNRDILTVCYEVCFGVGGHRTDITKYPTEKKPCASIYQKRKLSDRTNSSNSYFWQRFYVILNFNLFK